MHIKLILFAVCILCSRVLATESTYDEDSGIFSYLRWILQFPLSLWRSSNMSYDTDIGSISDHDRSSKETAGIFSFIERWLFFPAFLIDERDKFNTEIDSHTQDSLQICNAGPDFSFLEYGVETAERALDELKTRLYESCSLYEWKDVFVPLYYLRTKFLYYSKQPFSVISGLESLICHTKKTTPTPEGEYAITLPEKSSVSYFSDQEASVSSSIGHVLTATWTLIRYIVAGILALSLLSTVMKIDIKEIIRLVKQLLYTEKSSSSLDGSFRPSTSPIAKKPDHNTLTSMTRSISNFILSKQEKQTQLENLQVEHFPMCEYFDIKTCNCGGKSVCFREESPELRHFKMCEFFDLLPCNCGGLKSKIMKGREVNEKYEGPFVRALACDRTDITNVSRTTEDLQDPNTSDVMPHYSSLQAACDTDEVANISNEKEQLLEVVHEIVNQYLIRKYPRLENFRSSSDSDVNGNGKEGSEIDVTTKQQSLHAGHFIERDDRLHEAMDDIDDATTLIQTPIKHHHVSKDTDIKPYKTEGKLDTKPSETEISTPVYQSSDQKMQDTSMLASTSRSESQTDEIMGRNEIIRELMKCYKTKMESEPFRVCRNTVKRLKMDKEFMTKLNNLLGAGYYYRQYQANRFERNPVPFSSVPFVVNNVENDKDVVANKLSISESRNSIKSDHSLTESVEHETQAPTRKVKFAEDVFETVQPQSSFTKCESFDCGKFSEYTANDKQEHKDQFNLVQFLEHLHETGEPQLSYFQSDSYDAETVENHGENYEDQMDIDDFKPAYLDDVPSEDEISCEYVDIHILKDEDQIPLVEPWPEYLEDDSNENLLDKSESDIGSPWHNSTFKDDSPYTTANSVSLGELQPRKDEIIYSTITRRSPFVEAGLSDLSMDMSTRESERSLLDVSDINNSVSFYRDTGILEVAVMIAVQTMWRFAKRFWQQHMAETSQTAVAVEERENGLFVIKQGKPNTFKSQKESMNNSALEIPNNDSGQFESSFEIPLSSTKMSNAEMQGKEVEEYFTGTDVDTSEISDIFQEWDHTLPQELSKIDNWYGIHLNSVVTTAYDACSVISNSNNNARFRNRKRHAEIIKSDCENSSDCEGKKCIDPDIKGSRKRGLVVYKCKRSFKTISSTKSSSGEKRHQASSCKRFITQTTFLRQRKSKRRVKSIRCDLSNECFSKSQNNSIQRLPRSPIQYSEDYPNRDNSSDTSGNIADESSNSSDEHSEISKQLSQMKIRNVKESGHLCSVEKEVSRKSKNFPLQKNCDACTCIDCRGHGEKINSTCILSQLQALRCDCWELRDYRNVDKNDKKSKLLAWAWSCVENIE